MIDGGSQDRTVNQAEEEGVIVGCSKRGRGMQCNVGASLACGDILLFLHADTRLPEDAFEKLNQFFRNERVEIGTFRLKFDERNWILAFCALFSRFDSVFTRFGDQGIVIRKSFFKAIGGFPDWPLFEDVGILQAARRKTRIYSFPTAVTTSARRYMQNGVIRQQLQNLWYMIQYLSGKSPIELAAEYERRKRKAF